MTWAAALFVVVAFMALICALGLPRRAAGIVARSRQALADMRSTTLTEEQKEKAVQGHAIGLFGAFLLVTALSAVALAVPVGAVWLAAQGELVDFDAVMDATLSWQILVAATVLGFAMFALLRRRSS